MVVMLTFQTSCVSIEDNPVSDPVQDDLADATIIWSRWLLINESAHPAWSPSSFNFVLPEDDMSDIPTI